MRKPRRAKEEEEAKEPAKKEELTEAAIDSAGTKEVKQLKEPFIPTAAAAAEQA